MNINMTVLKNLKKKKKKTPRKIHDRGEVAEILIIVWSISVQSQMDRQM